MKKKTPVLPETVVDQIRLWEGERSRISFQNVVLYDFNNVNTFHKFLDFARKNEILLWHSPLPEKGKTGIQILKIAVKVGKEDIIKSFQKSIK